MGAEEEEDRGDEKATEDTERTPKDVKARWQGGCKWSKLGGKRGGRMSLAFPSRAGSTGFGRGKRGKRRVSGRRERGGSGGKRAGFGVGGGSTEIARMELARIARERGLRAVVRKRGRRDRQGSRRPEVGVWRGLNEGGGRARRRGMRGKARRGRRPGHVEGRAGVQGEVGGEGRKVVGKGAKKGRSEVGSGGEAVERRFRKGLLNDGFEVVGETGVRSEIPKEGGRPFDVLKEDIVGRTGKGRASGQEFGQKDAASVEVGAMVDLGEIADGLFGGHVARCTYGKSSLCKPPLARFVEHPSDAKVEDL